MIGIVIPAHNEEALLGACLASVLQAARHPGMLEEEVRIVVVLDRCTDRSRQVAGAFPVCILEADAACVGAARAQGADHLLSQGARWLAFTDADSHVCPRWLVDQLALGTDAVCGAIAVADWSGFAADAELMRHRFEAGYTDADGHRHIHGANLGVSAAAYRAAGGFQALACSEDVALVRALAASGASISWSASPRVFTSARLQGRAKGGFADTLRAVFRSHRCDAERKSESPSDPSLTAAT